jgi:hypothetical protein
MRVTAPQLRTVLLAQAIEHADSGHTLVSPPALEEATRSAVAAARARGVQRVGVGDVVLQRAAAIADGQPHGFGGLFQGGFADIGRMGIAGDLAPHGAQAKALFGVIAGIAQPAVVKDKRFGPGAFQKQFAILG